MLVVDSTTLYTTVACSHLNFLLRCCLYHRVTLHSSVALSASALSRRIINFLSLFLFFSRPRHILVLLIMENGHKNVSNWDNSLALCKFNAFASAVKLRLPVSPRTILKNFTKCNDLSSIVDSRNVSSVEKNSSDIFEWLRQEVRESCALLHMADGFLVDADGETVNFKNDVYLFSSDDTLKTAERRLSYALETILLFIECDKFRELARKFFKDALILAKSFDESGTVNRLQAKLGLDADAESTASLKKFRENDDLYVLQHGLNGYVDALDRILCKIGGREWDMQVLEVLEQKATMIVEFSQVIHIFYYEICRNGQKSVFYLDTLFGRRSA